MRRFRRRHSGFMLIEMLVVVAVIALVVYFAYVRKRPSATPGAPGTITTPGEAKNTLTHMRDRGQSAKGALDLSTVRTQVTAYRIAQGSYPGSLKILLDTGQLPGIDVSLYDYDPETGNVELK